jgi:hypothetical protein
MQGTPFHLYQTQVFEVTSDKNIIRAIYFKSF